MPLPNRLRLPFSDLPAPITLPFGTQSIDERIRELYQKWRIVGHHGIDFGIPEGTKVLAADHGTVIQTGQNSDYGISVTIKHSWGLSLYAHLSKTIVSVGQSLVADEPIGESGRSGAATGPHLHFGIKPDDPDITNGYLGFIDPSPYLFAAPTRKKPSRFRTSTSDVWEKLSVSRRTRQKPLK